MIKKLLKIRQQFVRNCNQNSKTIVQISFLQFCQKMVNHWLKIDKNFLSKMGQKLDKNLSKKPKNGQKMVKNGQNWPKID
jgi:hypothetical protein